MPSHGDVFLSTWADGITIPAPGNDWNLEGESDMPGTRFNRPDYDYYTAKPVALS